MVLSTPSTSIFGQIVNGLLLFYTANVNVKIIFIPINLGIFARLSNLGYCSNMAEQNRTRREGSMPIYR